MAYFPNGTSGVCFDEQCAICRYGEAPCPIALAQYEYNYKAVNNDVASDMLSTLVMNDGTCNMFETFKEDFSKPKGEQLEIWKHPRAVCQLRKRCGHG
jgi:transposase